MDVRVGTFEDITAEPEFNALAAEYADECAIAGLPRPNYNRDIYQLLEAQGFMYPLGVYEQDKLIGFAAVLVVLNPHYSQKLANTESFFIGQAHRKTGAGLALKRKIEEVARETGAIGLLICAPTNSKLAAVMEKNKHYHETNRVFFKSLANE